MRSNSGWMVARRVLQVARAQTITRVPVVMGHDRSDCETMLYGHLDEPVPGSRVRRGPLILRGWHRWGNDPAVAVAALVGGQVVGVARVGSELRPDVAESTGNPALIHAGWRLEVDLENLEVGIASFDLWAWGAVGSRPICFDSVEVVVVDADDDDDLSMFGPMAPADEFFGQIDLPDCNHISVPVFRLVGYALTEPHPVESLEIRLNGRSIGRARLGLERPDLERHHRVPHACISGFECLVELSEEAINDGIATVEVVARTAMAGPVVVACRSWDVLTRPANADAGSAARGVSSALNPVIGSRRPEGAKSPNTPLHVAAFTHDMGYGGGQLWLTELLTKAGAGDRFECTIVTTRSGPLVDVMRDRGLAVQVTQPFALDDLSSFDGRVAELAGWLSQIGCNAALANTFLTFPGMEAALLADLPAVWAIHESWIPTAIWSVAYPEGYVDPDVRQRASMVMRNVHALAFEAEATRLQYEAAASPGRTIVIPYGIDVDSVERYKVSTTREAARRELTLPDDCRVLLIMGTTEPRKAQTLLAEAFQQVARQYRDALLVMVGDTGTPYADALRTYVKQTGLSQQIRVLPVVRDTYRWYRAADMLICASDVESLPRSVLEAMCFGVPVLTTSVFGLRELIEDGETGFLFEPCDLSHAVAGLERVLSAPREELLAVAERGCELVRNEYDSTGYATDFLALLDGLRRNPEALPSDVLQAAGRRPGRRGRHAPSAW